MIKKIITCIIILFLVSCNKSKTKPMPEENEIPTNNPVIVKNFEGKFLASTIRKDTIEIVFIKQLSIDSNEYILKGIGKALKNYLKPNSTIEDKNYEVFSNEVTKVLTSKDSKIKFNAIKDNKVIVFQSEDLLLMKLEFNKL